MKTVEIGNKKVTIKFYYGRNGGSELSQNETKCIVHIANQQNERLGQFVGISRKHDQDMFCKEIARKKSLKSALRMCNDREQRRIVWLTYLTR